jgi:CDP-diacylglycerol--glycerol-3-phosphate 3-phosphatidyltransferase
MTSATPAPGVMNIANGLTVLRMALVPVFIVVLFADGGHNQSWRVAACAVFVVALGTDKIDGDIARSRGLVTNFGKIADPIADKALIGSALIGLSILGEVPWWITIVIMTREIGVTLLRFAVIRLGVIAASRGGKIKTVLQGVAIGLYLLQPTGVWQVIAQVTMYLALAVTVVTAADYIMSAIRLRRLATAGRAPGTV